MNKHRVQADGKLRDGDNWQGLFGSPEEHRAVCMKSMWRHFLDLWKFHRGYTGRDTIKEALCALLFNAQAYLFSILVEDQANKVEEQEEARCLRCGGTEQSGHQAHCKGGIIG